MALGTMSSLSYGAQYVTFPATGTEDTAVSTGWIYSDAGTDRGAFYDTIGTTPAVSVGAYYDDYAGVGSDFYIDHALGASINLTDAIMSWNFTITDAIIAPRNDFSFSLLDAASLNLATVNFSSNGNGFWNVSINSDLAFVAVEQGGNYTLNLSFGTSGVDASYAASINQFSGIGLISGGALASIEHVQIGENLGDGANFGDGYITVTSIPEPGTFALLSLLPAICILRRRRR